MLRAALSLQLAFLFSACVTIPEGIFACETDADCPNEMACAMDLRCYSPDGDEWPGADNRPGYRCPSGAISGTDTIPRDAVCNGIVECFGGEDEADCENVSCFDDPDFPTLIPRAFLCDGVPDCPPIESLNGRVLDEDECMFCGDSDEMISAAYVCDGFPDCADGSDEQECFLCDNGTVIPRWMICDGHAQCGPDGGDERDCPSGADALLCGDTLIPSLFWCDGAIDCCDGIPYPDFECAGTAHPEDEDPARCTRHLRPDATVGEWPATHYCDGQNLPAWTLCQGVRECADGSDERRANCPFICNDGTRIPRSLVCDGIDDCPFGEDESEALGGVVCGF